VRCCAWLQWLTCCLGTLELVGGIVVGGFFGLIWVLFTGCHEHVAQSIPSPTGEFVAIRVVKGCGGSAGSVQVFVRLHRVTGPSAEDETILQAPSHDFDFTMAWLDANTLAVDYILTPGYQKWVHFQPPERDVVLTLRPFRRQGAAHNSTSTSEQRRTRNTTCILLFLETANRRTAEG
jgi:hypothetical protein